MTEQAQDNEAAKNNGDARDHGNPKAFAGGWQGLDIVGQREQQQQQDRLRQQEDEQQTKQQPYSDNEQEEKANCWTRTITRFPRLYNVFFKIIIPLFVLIFVCFACGAGLARLEYDGERKANDATMSEFSDLLFLVSRLEKFTLSAPEKCLAQYDYGEEFNKTDLEIYMKECGERLAAEENEKTLEGLYGYFRNNEFNSITFNWMECRDESVTFTNRTLQAQYVINEWANDYQRLRAEYNQSLSDVDAHNRASSEATGSQSCQPNSAAGGIFWFTIMTTIGYGNTAPSSDGGRLMVYTLGFCSILVFTALISQAGSILLAIVDDIFLRWKRLKRFTEGLVACLFWLGMLLLWLLVIAEVFQAWAKGRARGTIDISDAYWFSFISSTTVGLGDIYIPHEVFEAVDLFYIPLIFLIAFVLLATFLLKFSIMVIAWFPQKSKSLSQILQESREERDRSNAPQREIAATEANAEEIVNVESAQGESRDSGEESA